MLENLAQDLRYALRARRRSPGLTAVAALSLALGIGANTAIFSLMDAVLLRTLPVEKPEELERIGVMDGSSPGFIFSYPMFRELRQRNQTFSAVFARAATPVSLVATGRTERGVVELVSGNYFSVLGVRPTLGRALTDADDRTPMAHPVAVLSYRYWNRRLAADPGIVGKTIRIDNYPFTVIGVAPPAFCGIEVGSAPDAWIPMMMQPQVFGRGRPSFNEVGAAGALPPGMTLTSAGALGGGATPALRREVQALDKDLPVFNVKTFAEQKNESLVRERLIATLSGFFGALALALASIGLYGVMAYSVQRRTREIGIRMSLGAARGMVLQMVLRDCLRMVMAGVALGLPLSMLAPRLVSSQLYGVSPADPVTIATAGLILTSAAALAGYLPASRASRVDPLIALRHE